MPRNTKIQPSAAPGGAVFITTAQLRQRYGGMSHMWVERKLKSDPDFPAPSPSGRCSATSGSTRSRRTSEPARGRAGGRREMIDEDRRAPAATGGAPSDEPLGSKLGGLNSAKAAERPQSRHRCAPGRVSPPPPPEPPPVKDPWVKLGAGWGRHEPHEPKGGRPQVLAGDSAGPESPAAPARPGSHGKPGPYPLPVLAIYPLRGRRWRLDDLGWPSGHRRVAEGSRGEILEQMIGDYVEAVVIDLMPDGNIYRSWIIEDVDLEEGRR